MSSCVSSSRVLEVGVFGLASTPLLLLHPRSGTCKCGIHALEQTYDDMTFGRHCMHASWARARLGARLASFGGPPSTSSTPRSPSGGPCTSPPRARRGGWTTSSRPSTSMGPQICEERDPGERVAGPIRVYACRPSKQRRQAGVAALRPIACPPEKQRTMAGR